MNDIKEIMEKLKAPFRADEIEWLVNSGNADTKKGLAIPYITNRAIQDRLDNVCGIENWKNEFIEWKDKSQLCGISIRLSGEWVTKWDGADNTNIEGTKGGLSGSMKRAASQWGIGRYLYQLPLYRVDVIVIERGNKTSFKIKTPPILPNWALPNQSNIPVVKWDEDKNIPLITEEVQKCIDAFGIFNITKEEIETYMQLEAWMLSDKDIETLRSIYRQLNMGTKKKEDFFYKEISSKKQNTKALEAKLEGG